MADFITQQQTEALNEKLAQIRREEFQKYTPAPKIEPVVISSNLSYHVAQFWGREKQEEISTIFVDSDHKSHWHDLPFDKPLEMFKKEGEDWVK